MLKRNWQKIVEFVTKREHLILSFIIHLIILLSFVQITLYTPPAPKQPQAASIIFDDAGDTKTRLKYNDKSLVDGIRMIKTADYVVPNINPAHVLPDIDLNVEPFIRKSFDYIHVNQLAHSNFRPALARQPLYTVEEQLAGAFAKNVQVMRRRGLDIIFLFDSTWSMGEYLDHVKARITGLVSVIKKLVPSGRIGLVTYRDHGADYVTRAFQLSYGTRGLKIFFENLLVGQGGDREEAIYEGLKVSIEEMNWKKDSVKIIILSGDAPPHPETIDASALLAKKFREEMGGILSSLDLNRPTPLTDSYINCPPGVEGPCDTILYENLMEEFVLLAQSGGGQCLRFTEWERVNEMMVRLIFGGDWNEYWDIFVKNL